MRRIVVLGGTGFFGRAAVELLRREGLAPFASSRGRRPIPADRPAVLAGAPLPPAPHMRIDAEDPGSIRAVLRAGDVVLDAAGPFQGRSAALVEAACELGFDVIDISDALDHHLEIDRLRPRIETAGIRVLTSCSSLTTLTAALVVKCGMTRPVRVSVFLSPASRETANSGTGASLVHSLGRRIVVLRGGRLTAAVGWRESRPFRMPPPIGQARGYLMEGVHAVTLPRLWPTLRDVDFWVDSRVPGLNLALSLAARMPPLRRLVERARHRGLLLSRLLGSRAGGMLVEVEEADGRLVRAQVAAPRRSYLAAVAPAVLAAADIARGEFAATGLVPHDRQADPDRLLQYLGGLGIVCRVEKVPRSRQG
jgi:hypothetical protein